MTGSGVGRAVRSEAVSRSLALLSDEQLRAGVAAARPLGAGIGGHTFKLLVGDVAVFVKRVPLTDVEREPAHDRSTANVFALPAYFHYGVGSAGSGAWRELAAHRWASDWVLSGLCDGFPLLHHWRVLESEPAAPPGAPSQALVDSVAFWHGNDAVRERLAAVAESSAGLYLFLEYFPQNLEEWLTDRLAAGSDVLDGVCEQVAADLLAAVSCMSSHGLQHFDAHVRNILTDGHRLYVSDFGLALSSQFDLTFDEMSFLNEHQDHDLAYVVRELVNWLVEAFADDAATWTDATTRDDLVRRCAEGEEAVGLPPRAAALAMRFAPVAVVMNDFYGQLHRVSRRAAFPAREVRLALAASGLNAG